MRKIGQLLEKNLTLNFTKKILCPTLLPKVLPNRSLKHYSCTTALLVIKINSYYSSITFASLHLKTLTFILASARLFLLTNCIITLA